MTNTKNTKHALLSSVLALFLCFAMLLGTTYAWFTDSVTSANNIIKSGNLDIELYHSDDKADRAKVDNTTVLFDDIALWEPGAVVYETLEVVNEGDLALKYQLVVNVTNATANANGNTLSNILKVGVIEGGATITDRVALIGAVDEWMSLSSFVEAGDLVNKNESDIYTVVIYWEPSEYDNDYNMNNGKGDPLTLDIGVTLFATQQMSEKDSFGDNYDEYAGLPWDGESKEDPKADENGVIHVTNAAELVAMMDTTGNSIYSGKTIVLDADINLGGKTVKGIGGDSNFAGVFDGQGHTISNFTVDASNRSYYAGLFNQVSHGGTVKNLTVKGATIIGNSMVGAVASSVDSSATVDNCRAIGCTLIGVKKVGAVVGYSAGSTVTNNYAENCAVYYSEKEGAEILGYENTGSTVNNNTFKNVAVVKSVTVSTAEQFAAAVTGSDETIVVTLANNIDVPMDSLGSQTPGSGEYKLGGDATEAITIDLNGKKLTITTSYMSAIGAKNADATITIKNGSINSTGNKSTTWNINDLMFANCNYVFEKVTFDKEVALTNIGKTVEMKDVTINGTGDYYALWITAEGQTVKIDGLTVNSAGRGIKIDEQYVDTNDVAKVTLNVSDATFDTSKKAAIVVKSVKGADITLNSVDISNTIDTTHAVWVDEDSDTYADFVTVTGGKVISEVNVVASADDLTNAIAKGKTELYLVGEGNFDMPTTSGEVTISGTKDTVITVNKQTAEKVTLNGVTVKGSGNYTGIQHSNTVIYENCTLVGTQFLYADNVVIRNCVIDLTAAPDYIWTYGAKNVEFINCVFNTAGKAILIYHEGVSTVTNVTVKGCTFNATSSALASGSVAAAIEIDSSISTKGKYTLTTENNIVDSDFSGEWRVKKSGTNNTVVNGVVYNKVEDGLYKDDAGNYYVYNAAGLQSLNTVFTNGAFGHAIWGATFNIIADIDASSVTWNSVNLNTPNNDCIGFTWDGHGHTISGLNINGSGLFSSTANGKNTDVPATFKNLTFDGVSVTAGYHVGIIWGQMYGDIALENVHIKNSTVTGTCNVGAFIGRNGDEGESTVAYKNCFVTNTVITATGNGDPNGASVFQGSALTVGTSATAKVTFENCTQSGNTLTSADGHVGGGIYAWWNASTNATGVVSGFENYN